jgi:predicted TIM-barrel fold metal-dependent hydrolase
MLTTAMSRLMQGMFHSFYAILCLAKIETRASVLLPASSRKQSTRQNAKESQQQQPVARRSLAERLPAETWDGHMHVVDPKRYPLASSAIYTPSTHSVWDAVSFENTVSMKNILLVQPSIYGNDNSAMLDAMKALGPERSRGVVVFDESTVETSTLQEWHEMGVRGVRLNLASTSQNPDLDAFRNTIKRYAELVEPFGWMVQIYMSMDLLSELESTIKELGVQVCFDHFAQPAKPPKTTGSKFDPYSINGFSSLIRLLQHGNVFVKFSAPYRVALDSHQLDAVAKEILRVQNDRVVFATDWPHTRFEGLDIKPFEERCLEWAEDAGCVEKVFSTNARKLWSV